MLKESSPRTMVIKPIPESPIPVNSLMVANMAKLCEKALANPKKAVTT